MQDVQRTTPQSNRVSTAEVGGALKGRAPQNIGLNVTAFSKILIERRKSIGHCVGSDIMTKSGQTNAIDDFDAAMMCQSQRATGSRPPYAHSRRIGLMNVKFQERAGIGIDRISVRHGSLHSETWLPPQ